jgi:molybdate/tungstate transport system substrate-binding protein
VQRAGAARSLAAGAVLSVLAGCGAGAGSSPPGPAPARKGAVSVLYAGSLVNLMEHDLGPEFARASGYTYEGVGAGSTELVAQIKGGIRHGDVFISASPSANQALEGAANGDLVRWYTTFAQAPLVIGYNPKSSVAAQLRSQPWYHVFTQPGIRVGRTDPALDPKGKLTVQAIDEAASELDIPALADALRHFDVFPEETLVGRLEAGQLDAGFLYSNEAAEQHIPTVTLAPVSLSATYTVTVLQNATAPAAGEAFVAFLLGPTGRATLARHGVTVVHPALSGAPDSVPRSLRPLVASTG